MKGTCRGINSNPVHSTDPAKTTRIVGLLLKGAQDSFKAFLQKNTEVFTWSHKDVLGIDANVIAHLLNIDPKYRFVKQKCRAFNLEHYEAIKAEVDKLLKANFIKSIRAWTTQLGSSMLSWSRKPTGSGEYVWTSRT